MILPAAMMLGAHLMMPVADSVPTLNVEQVCQGIAQQGGVSFHDTDTADEKKNCLDSEKAIRDELAKEWSTFAPADKIACTNESRMGGEFELYRVDHLPGNGARRADHEQRAGAILLAGGQAADQAARARKTRSGNAGKTVIGRSPVPLSR